MTGRRWEVGAIGGAGGSVTVELVALVPVLILFVVVIVGFGRYERARGGVTQAAAAGAEAAAVAASPSEARQAAGLSTAAVLGGRECTDPRVTLDSSAFVPGGTVRVVVTCTVTFADLGVPGLPGSEEVQASAMAPIDPYRSVSP